MGSIRGALFPPVKINWDELGWVCQLEKEAELGLKLRYKTLAFPHHIKMRSKRTNNVPWNPCVGNSLHKAAEITETGD